MRNARLLLLTVIGSVLGCAARGPTGGGADDALGGVPVDFSVDVTVVVGPEKDVATSDLSPPSSVSARPGHYVMLADGSLHWAPGEAEGLPPRRRILDLHEVAGLWSLAQQLGLADPIPAETPVNPTMIKAEPGQTVYLAILTGRRQRWAYERRTDPGQPPDEVMARFVERLAGLAWVEPTASGPDGMRRYDFGPDPYQRYRR